MIETYIASGILGLIGIYCIIMKKNLIKKIIGLGILTNCIHLLFISIGFRNGGIPAIITKENLEFFANYAVDPLPQALVLTSIVVQLSVTAFALTISILVFRHFKTLETDKIKNLEG
ncbi:MAG: sodium:proton antiporter [Candidatus Aenigmatarchaeota archaeon]